LPNQAPRVMEGRMLALAFSAAMAPAEAHIVRAESGAAADIARFARAGLPKRPLNEPLERIRATVPHSRLGLPPAPR